MIDSHNIRKISWTFLAILMFFMVVGPSNVKYFWHVFFTVSVLALIWTLYLVYVCEKLTVYFTSLLATPIIAFCLLACNGAYFAGVRLWGDASIYTFSIWIAPAGITFTAYLLLANSKPSFHPFEYDGIKVQPRPQNKLSKTNSYNTVLLAGVSTLAASIFIKAAGPLAALMVATLGLTACSITLLYYARHIIRGLHLLRSQEKTMPSPYTFMQIDDIREARSRWWISRFFKWAASWSKSPRA